MTAITDVAPFVPGVDRSATTIERIYRRGLAAATVSLIQPLLGTPYLSLADRREAWWTLDDGERHRWRLEALEHILGYAASHVPAYEGLPAELDRFPVIDKQTIIDDPASYLSSERDRRPVVWKHTGGSTGDPWNYPLDRRAWAEFYATQIYQFRRHGVHYGDRRLLLGYPSSLGLHNMSISRRVRMMAERTDAALSSLELDRSADLDRAVSACKRNVRLWYGYASTIAGMAAAVLDAGRTLPGPRLIVTMAEPLWPAWRRDIAAAFGSTVIEEYGCNDGGITAYRCPADNLHMADHQSYVEVIDETGRRCEPGEGGELVITNFHARHMPFIRYRSGDTAILGPRRCPCGQPGETLSAVTGRSGDFVQLPDGTELVPAAFFIPFNQVKGVRRWQMVQPDTESLIIRIEARPSWNDDERDTIVNWVRERTGGRLRIRLTTDEPFERTSGGKHRIIIRRF